MKTTWDRRRFRPFESVLKKDLPKPPPKPVTTKRRIAKQKREVFETLSTMDLR